MDSHCVCRAALLETLCFVAFFSSGRAQEPGKGELSLGMWGSGEADSEKFSFSRTVKRYKFF